MTFDELKVILDCVAIAAMVAAWILLPKYQNIEDISDWEREVVWYDPVSRWARIVYRRVP